jgi:hypothetical protein
MLTASQGETVALATDGSIICLDCARREFGEFGVEAIIEGIAEFLPQDVLPISRYELDDYWGEILWERAEEDVDDRLDGRFPEFRDRLVQREFDRRSDEGYPCDGCRGEIS